MKGLGPFFLSIGLDLAVSELRSSPY